MKLLLENEIRLVDGTWAEVADVIVDPCVQAATYLVVRLPDRSQGCHLLPVNALTARGQDPELRWPAPRVHSAPAVEEVDFLSPYSWSRGRQSGQRGADRIHACPSAGRSTAATLIGRLPTGSAEVRRDSMVISGDFDLVGTVEGLILDQRFGITHLIVDRGPLWSRRELCLAISDVADMTSERVQLRVPRQWVTGTDQAALSGSLDQNSSLCLQTDSNR